MEFPPESIQKQLDQLLASEVLAKSPTNRRLLAYVVQRSLLSGDGPKELEIAIDVFGRDAGFNGAEDSVVRVGMRNLRQKLLEYYSGSGRHDTLVFDIPKGAYRATVTPGGADRRPDPTLHAEVELLEQAGGHHGQRWKQVAVVLVCALVASLTANVLSWRSAARNFDSNHEAIRSSALWAPMADSRRPLMFVLGDLFMFTQTDPTTGRTLTVRDAQINSSEDLRAFLASNPTLAAGRGLRYSSMLQKSTAVGMVEILRVLENPGRTVEVRLRDELRAEDIRDFDIIYVGPITRLGPLASDYHARSRYRFDAETSGVTDSDTGKVYAPEGSLGEHHKDYALVARYPGPAGNSIMVFTSGGRNSGLLQIVRTLTSPEGLQKFWEANDKNEAPPAAFEALVAVSGYKQTDLSVDLVQLHALSGESAALAGSNTRK
ncbi:MAG: hypothetical protein ABI616_12755 [Pseudomonadota bacterium]